MDRALERAARLSALPGITLAVACERFGVTKTALQRARKQLGPHRPSRDDLVLAILTDYAAITEGTLPELGPIASYIDYVEHDGTTVTEVRAIIDELARREVLEVTTSRWRLLRPWP